MDDETFVVQIVTTECHVQYSISVQWLEQVVSEQSSEKRQPWFFVHAPAAHALHWTWAKA